MKSYAPYLLYQIARFGALTVPQMLRLCEQKCGRSSLYRALAELVKGNYAYPVLNPASRTRAYYATKEGREYVFGGEQPLTPGVKARELDHTVQCAEVLLELSQYENVTGFSTHFELSTEDVQRFCHERIPDGLFRLTQDGQQYELALEVESSVRNMARVHDVLNHYWQTFKYGMPCSGLLIVAMTSVIYGMYTKACKTMPEEFQSRVRIVEGQRLTGISADGYGRRVDGPRCSWDLTRTSFQGEISYMPVKAEVFLSQTRSQNPHGLGLGQ